MRGSRDRSAPANPEMDAYIDDLVENAVVPETHKISGSVPHPLCLGASEAATSPERGSAAPAEAAPDEELLRAERGLDFSFDGMSFPAKVVDLYDGDTVRVCFRLKGEIIQWRARMAGYDSPEMKPSKASPTRVAERAAALAARDALAAKVGGRLVTIECGPFDKYGRLLVTILLPGPGGAPNLSKGENVNEWMVAQGHGVPYDGGTKKTFAPR